jgi:hypothetical protein
MGSLSISPKDKKIRDFVGDKIRPYFDRDSDGTEFEGAVKAVREFLELCLTGQGEFSIFQREEQAPKETPRPE